MESYFTLDNTQGYTQAELDAFNTELDALIAEDGCEPSTDAWYQLCKRFADMVTNR